MAEAVDVSENAKGNPEKANIMECAVCLQTCVLPAQLPCGHIFCYLCVKGFANQNKRCAMCRQEIPRDFIEQPNLLQITQITDTSDGFDGGYQWFYEGRNGWWQYDERTSQELEQFYKKGEKTCELLIAGFLYVIDLENMLQLRRNDPSRRRRIKRDFSSIVKKGIAGLRCNDDNVPNSDTQNLRSLNLSTEDPSDITITPTNTPQSNSTSGRESPVLQNHMQEVVDGIYNLNLHQNNDTNFVERRM